MLTGNLSLCFALGTSFGLLLDAVWDARKVHKSDASGPPPRRKALPTPSDEEPDAR